MDKKNLLWSSLYDEWLNCDDYMNCKHCDEGCISYDGDIAYDILDDVIMGDLVEKFENNDYEYFVVGVDYVNYYGMFQNMNGHSNLYEDIKSLIFDCLATGDVHEGFRIYKGKRNSLFIERVHHDGVEYYQVCRLSKSGERYYENNYNIDFSKYMLKGVLKDFNYF